jgi:hypothetical protein
VDLFRKLKQLNLAPNSISYALLIEILADNDRLTDGMRFLETMRQKVRSASCARGVPGN